MSAIKESEALAKQRQMAKEQSLLLTGEMTYWTLKKELEKIMGSAPKGHDVIVQAFDLSVLEIVYVKPHVLLFRGLDEEGNDTTVLSHFSQIVARIITIPTNPGASRVITGFSRTQTE